MLPNDMQVHISRNLIRRDPSTAVALAASPWQWAPLAEVEDDELFDLPAPPPPPAAADPSQPAARRGTGYGLDEIMQEAESIIAEAQARADRILGQATQAGAELRETLRQEVWEQARAELAAQADPRATAATEDLARAGAALSAAAELVATSRAGLHAGFEREVIGAELETRPEHVVEAVRDTVSRAGGGELTVRLHPADLALVQQQIHELKLDPAGGLLDFEEDAGIERGGCVVATPNGTISSQPYLELDQLRGLED